MSLHGYFPWARSTTHEDAMLGLYAIAFLAPLLVFGSFGYYISSLQSQKKVIFSNQQKALTLFVYIPIGISYGLIVVILTWQFISYIQQL